MFVLQNETKIHINFSRLHSQMNKTKSERLHYQIADCVHRCIQRRKKIVQIFSTKVSLLNGKMYILSHTSRETNHCLFNTNYEKNIHE